MSLANISYSQRGFTLIELIIGIVIFSIAMTMLTSLIYPQVQRSIDPIYQVRATELANTLINEIQAKPYDENSKPWLGLGRCDEVGHDDCTPAENLGPETEPQTETRDLFDDVDDYHDLTIAAKHLFSGDAYQDLYKNFKLSVTVFYDGDFDGIKDVDPTSRGAKLVNVVVTTPNGDEIKFATYRSNY